jgi:hypothetical protein
MQKAEPHDAAAPSGTHKTNANESRFIVPQRWNFLQTTRCYGIQRQEETGGARGGKVKSGVDRGGTAPVRNSRDGTDDRCKAQAAGAGSIMSGTPARMHEEP